MGSMRVRREAFLTTIKVLSVFEGHDASHGAAKDYVLMPLLEDPAERSALRLFYRDWRPTRVGKAVSWALAWLLALGGSKEPRRFLGEAGEFFSHFSKSSAVG